MLIPKYRLAHEWCVSWTIPLVRRHTAIHSGSDQRCSTFSSHSTLLKLSKDTIRFFWAIDKAYHTTSQGLTFPNGPTNTSPSHKFLWHICMPFVTHPCAMAQWLRISGLDYPNGQVILRLCRGSSVKGRCVLEWVLYLIEGLPSISESYVLQVCPTLPPATCSQLPSPNAEDPLEESEWQWASHTEYIRFFSHWCIASTQVCAINVLLDNSYTFGRFSEINRIFRIHLFTSYMLKTWIVQDVLNMQPSYTC